MSTAASQAWSQANRHKDRNLLKSADEDLYLMGYSFTLCSFMGLLIVSDGFRDIGMGPAAAKLLTSVIGLAFLVLTHNHARSWPEKPRSGGALDEAEIEFAATLESVKSWATELNLGLQTSTQWLRSSQTQEFINGGTRLGVAVHTAAMEISNGNRVLVDAIHNTTQAAKGLEKCLTQMLAAKQQTQETAAKLSENAEKVGLLTDSTAASLESTQRRHSCCRRFSKRTGPRLCAFLTPWDSPLGRFAWSGTKMRKMTGIVGNILSAGSSLDSRIAYLIVSCFLRTRQRAYAAAVLGRLPANWSKTGFSSSPFRSAHWSRSSAVTRFTNPMASRREGTPISPSAS